MFIFCLSELLTLWASSSSRSSGSGEIFSFSGPHPINLQQQNFTCIMLLVLGPELSSSFWYFCISIFGLVLCLSSHFSSSSSSCRCCYFIVFALPFSFPSSSSSSSVVPVVLLLLLLLLLLLPSCCFLLIFFFFFIFLVVLLLTIVTKIRQIEFPRILFWLEPIPNSIFLLIVTPKPAARDRWISRINSS